MENYNTLSILIIAPLALAVLSFFAPKGLQRAYTILGSLAVLLVSLFQVFPVLFSTASSVSMIEQKINWLPAMGISLSLRLDSVSLWFVLLNAVVAIVAFSLKGPWYRKNPKLFSVLGFALVAFLNGAFLSSDLIFFYLFYESVFIPIIFMVGVWGESAKASAVFKFFLMSLLGSVLMLVSIFYLISLYHAQTGQYSSSIIDLTRVASGSITPQLEYCFLGFFLAFAVKVPLFPFHGWLKDIYTLAPMPATIWMSAVLSKLGVFGFIRFVSPLFMNIGIQNQTLLLWVSAVSILYTAFLAIRSSDPKTLLAFSSISHLGFVMMGVFSFNQTGTASALLLSMGHGLVSSALFYVLHLLEERKENLSLNRVYGLARLYPVLFTLTFVVVLASVSLPGTLNFVGEFMALLSAFQSNHYSVAVAGLGIILGAIYMFKFYQQLGLGVATKEDAVVTATGDIGFYDFVIIASIILLVVFLGFQPVWILKGNG